MTFDAGGRDGVNDTTWSYFEEDLIVPYTTAGEIGDCGGGGGDCGDFFLDRRVIGERYVDLRDAEQDIIEPDDAFLSSSFNSDAELGSGFCARGILEWSGMDPLPKYDVTRWPSCGTYLGNSTSAAKVDSPVDPAGETEMQRSFYGFAPLDYMGERGGPVVADHSFSLSMDQKADFDNNSGLSISNYDDCGDCFLGCDWVSNSKFDDPDGIFSDTTFWDGEISKNDGILSRSDSINDNPRALPRPDCTRTEMVSVDYCHVPMDGKSLGKRKHFEDDKNTANAFSLGEQASTLPHFSSRMDHIVDMKNEKVDMGGTMMKSRRVESNENGSLNVSTMWLEDDSAAQQSKYLPSAEQSRMPVFCYQDRSLGEGYNFYKKGEVAQKPSFVVPGSLPPITSVGNENRPLSTCNIDYKVTSEKPYKMNNLGVATGNFQQLNPQEKRQKLKRRQQMQAMLAIEMQQKQLDEKMNYARGCHFNNVYPEERKSTWSAESKNSVKQEGFPDTSGDGSSITESTVHQLGNIISKMDKNLKICMRDSLFRLAKSASERMSDDRSSMTTNGRCEDKVASNSFDKSHRRVLNLPNMEPETNRIDRVVALLLFNGDPQIFNDLVFNGTPSCKPGGT